MSEDKIKTDAPEAAAADEVKDNEFEDLEGDDLQPIVATKIKKPMSSFGIGPLFGLISIGLTVLAILLRDKWIFESGVPSNKILRYIYLGLGIALAVIAFFIYINALFNSRIGAHIKAGKLCKEGIYGWTRHPVYTAILLACTGALFISGNVYMYAIPIILWILLTILLKKTEEPDLFKRFGQEYADYYATVNRVLPKPPAR